MFRIVTARTLSALREDAGQVPFLREQLAATQRDAEDARATATAAKTAAKATRSAFEVLQEDRVIGLAALRDAVRDPQRRASARGLIATELIRQQISAELAKSGGEADPGLRLLEALFVGDGEAD
jgi:hypothetical protein